MRKDVKKFLFLGLADEKKSFFQQAQKLGFIHFIDPCQTSNRDIPEAVEKLTTAIKILRGLPFVEQEENYQPLNSNAIVENILSLCKKSEKKQEEIRVLRLEMSRIEIFGNFSLEDIYFIENEGKRKIQFFVARSSAFKEQDPPDELIYISSNQGLDYYFAINEQSVSYDKLIEIKIDRSLQNLNQQLIEANSERRRIDHQLKELAKYNEFLHHALVDKLNSHHLNHAQTYVQQTMDGLLFAVEGWVPANKVDQIEKVTKALNVYIDEVAIEASDVIPTYLENSGFSRLGEDLVNIYDTPSPSDHDPSNWVLWCFTLFFAFIIGDAGYGFIYLALALFLRYKYPDLKGLSKRLLNLFTILCVGCIVWGTLMTSFFGMQIDINNPIRKISLVQWLSKEKIAYHIAHQDSTYQKWLQAYPTLANHADAHEFVSFIPDWEPSKGPVILSMISDTIMFELALFIGVVHLLLSLLRYGLRNIPNLGWAAFLIGAYLYFPSHLQAPSFLNFIGNVDLNEGGKIGLQFMIGGIAFAWITSIWKNGWTGIFEITVLIQVFADVLSYLRLYALALAGAVVGATVNEIASGLPLLASFFLVMIAHFVNLILGTMGGVIHGLRLNFLEWYHYSFEGGGKKFQPLKLLKIE
ncbi:V-type ATP synthase subunit I [Candidatus Protochlamydia sp. R18]|uniref:V-type ATP synthase subunit I n=1 Tax=Candidatus Protochlamydia sp. R18 TaxID=1353977 RepID=UPI0005A7EF9F|nr:V-type ATP synthase subunit I [Candidatus Protochlamydia sp. R18]